MNSKRVIRGGLGLLSVALCAGSVVGTAVAGSACKGLEQGPCEGKADCTWVEGYVRKDGIKVSAHCKSAGRSSGAASTVDKQVASKDKEEKASSKE